MADGREETGFLKSEKQKQTGISQEKKQFLPVLSVSAVITHAEKANGSMRVKSFSDGYLGNMSETEHLRPRDTSPQLEQVQISLLRRASVARRIASARSLSETVIDLSRRGIRRANPGLGGKELACMIVAHHYGPALGARLRTCLDSREE
jgi:hypothetical protein